MSMCFGIVCFVSFCIMDHLEAVKLLCLEQKDYFLKKNLEEFLSLVPAASFLDDCLCSFLHASLNTVTRVQLSGKGL